MSASRHSIGFRLMCTAHISEIPRKLVAKRVQRHLRDVLAAVRASPESGRDCARAHALLEITWDTLDLYTLAYDLCDDDELRFLVGQARGMIALALVKQSSHQR